jgi:Zn-dependent protease with chaperone function
VLVYLLLAAGRRRAVPVMGVDLGGELAAELRSLAARAGLARPPRFVVDPAAITASAVAFGLPGWHTVCLHGGLVARFRSDPEGFRAVVLHELAHIKNRDIGLTYATIAAWRVYLVALLLSATVSGAWQLLSGPVMLGTGAGTQLFWPGVRTEQLKSLAVMAFLVLLVYLARADVMRARETYADLDAAIWDARTAALQGNGKQPGPLAAFWQLWRTHPIPRQRAEVLTDASAVFRVSSLQMFLTGAAAVVILYWFQGDLSPLNGTLAGRCCSGADHVRRRRGVVAGSR